MHAEVEQTPRMENGGHVCIRAFCDHTLVDSLWFWWGVAGGGGGYTHIHAQWVTCSGPTSVSFFFEYHFGGERGV